MAGIARWALDGLDDLVDQSPLGEGTVYQHVHAAHITETQESKDYRNEVATGGSPVRAFVEEVCTLEEDASVPTQDLYRSYTDWCADNGIKTPLSKSVMLRALKDAYPGQFRSAQSGTRNNRYQITRGLAVTHPVAD